MCLWPIHRFLWPMPSCPLSVVSKPLYHCRLHIDMRLVECWGHTLRDARRSAAIPSPETPRDTTEGAL